MAVGQIAKERLITHPKDTAASFKKKMGTTQNYVLGGRNFLPEELSGFVISAIVEDARNYLQEDVEDVIISVPAYFHDKQRVATKRAGALAGVMVKRPHHGRVPVCPVHDKATFVHCCSEYIR